MQLTPRAQVIGFAAISTVVLLLAEKLSQIWLSGFDSELGVREFLRPQVLGFVLASTLGFGALCLGPWRSLWAALPRGRLSLWDHWSATFTLLVPLLLTLIVLAGSGMISFEGSFFRWLETVSWSQWFPPLIFTALFLAISDVIQRRVIFLTHKSKMMMGYPLSFGSEFLWLCAALGAWDRTGLGAALACSAAGILAASFFVERITSIRSSMAYVFLVRRVILFAVAIWFLGASPTDLSVPSIWGLVGHGFLGSVSRGDFELSIFFVLTLSYGLAVAFTPILASKTSGWIKVDIK